jgi:hypothetical protein
MPGLGKTGTVRGSASVSPARSQEIYRHYAVALYRQALLNPGDAAPAGHVACNVLVNECALAAIPERGEDDARCRLAESAVRRFRQLATRAGVARSPLRAGSIRTRVIRRPGVHPGQRSAGIHPRELAALLRVVLRSAGGQGAAGHAAVPGDEEDVTRAGRSRSSAVRLRRV